MNRNLMLVYPKEEKSSFKNRDISLALLYLSGACREICDNIEIYDFNTPRNESYENFDTVIKNNNISVIGINCLFSGLFPTVMDIAEHIRVEFPHIKIVVGGLHPTMYANEIMEKCNYFDAVIIGEGESSIVNLLRYWYGEINENRLEGLVLRDDAFGLRSYPVKGYIENLDNIPRPGYEYFNFKDYEIDTSKWYDPKKIGISKVQMPILTSRSCPNKCAFCNMRLIMGDRCRMRSAENVFDEIKFLYNEFGINYFRIMDDNFTLSKKRTIEISKAIIDSGIKISFETPNGLMVRTLDEEVINFLSEAGLVRVGFAIESGSEYIRSQVIGKPIPEAKIYEISHLFRKRGVISSAFFVIGFPEETEKTLSETLEMIKKIEVDYINMNIITPFPGTVLFEQCSRDNLFIDKYDNSKELWKGEIKAFLATKSSTKYYIKPYSLSIDKLSEWCNRILEAVKEKNYRWDKWKAD